MSLSSCYATKLTQVKFPQAEDRKRRRRPQEDDGLLPSTTTTSQKRQRTSPPISPIKDTIGENTAAVVSEKDINLIEYWTKERTWPRECLDPESNMSYLLAKKKSFSSLRGKQSEAGSAVPSSTTLSDQRPREAKSALYQSPQYKILLETKGSFMRKSELGISDTSKTVCRTLVKAEQRVLEDSLFLDRNLDTSQPSSSRDLAPPLLRLAQARLSFGSCLLRSAHPSRQTSSTFNEGPEKAPFPSQGSQICSH
jgi:hypothetical protein